jgi:Tfp pilus assembly protein PilV
MSKDFLDSPAGASVQGLDALRSPAARGFTLIEALAALVFIGIVMPVVLQAITLSLAMGSHTARQAEAVLLAQSKLAELIATSAWQDQGSQLSGDFGTVAATARGSTTLIDTTSNYRWEAMAQDWLDPCLKELVVRVSWQSRSYEREVILTTLVYSAEDDENASGTSSGTSGGTSSGGGGTQ